MFTTSTYIDKGVIEDIKSAKKTVILNIPENYREINNNPLTAKHLIHDKQCIEF